MTITMSDKKTLEDIISEIDHRVISGDVNVPVTHIVWDSRNAGPGGVFVAVEGDISDGHSFIEKAMEGGISAVVCDSLRSCLSEEELVRLSERYKVPVVEMNETRIGMAQLSMALYDHPEKQLKLIGITGTKGKTTSAFMLHRILQDNGHKTGLMGTVCNMMGEEKIDADHTTPEAPVTYEFLSRLAKSGYDSCVMEVSSLGLKYLRNYGLNYKAGCFTNLYNDHIGGIEHPDMDDYYNSKLMIFDESETAVVNIDDEHGQTTLRAAGKCGNVIKYGIVSDDCDLKAYDIKPMQRDGVNGTAFTVRYKAAESQAFIPIPGKFNVYNALCAIACAISMGIDINNACTSLSGVSVPGRMQPVANDLGFNVVVDYAHNGEALTNVIETVREFTPGRVITLFGCGGDRPPKRRTDMGEVAGKMSDLTIVTSDNPRFEEPLAIIGIITEAIEKESGKYVVEPDRRKAIRMAIREAKAGDTVIVAGKGHEDYQEIKGVKYHFDDYEECVNAVGLFCKEKGGYMFTLAEIAQATGGKIVHPGLSEEDIKDAVVCGVSKDTRTIREKDLYIAIKGERFDGHDFISDAISKGASIVLGDNEEKIPDGVIAVIANDTVEAIGKLARHYRLSLAARVICVTGSVGKTSTREMIACALGSGMKVHSTKMNENNEIGMPMSILTAPMDTEALVLELGMRLKGEISYLTNIACPDIAVITCAGYSHIERLGSRENIRDAKCEIMEGLRKRGLIIVNGDDKELVEYVSSIVPEGRYVASVSVSGNNSKLKAEAYAENVKFERTGGVSFDVSIRRTKETEKICDVTLKLNGIHNVRNSLFALLCSSLSGVPFDGAVKAVSDFDQPQGRGKVIYTKRFTVIDDAYNASPESMEAAFGNLEVLGAGKRSIAVLGGMLELGDFAPELHKQVGRSCGGYGFDAVFVTGDQKSDFVEGIRSTGINVNVVECQDTEDVKNKLKDYVADGDVLLFKASHSFGFEKLAAEFATMGDMDQ